MAIDTTPIGTTFYKIVTGNKTITSAGTAVALLATTTPCKRVDVVAQFGNAGTIYVGDSAVLASTKTGMPLPQGSSYTVYLNDVSGVFVDSTSSNDKVSFIYYV